MTLTQILKQHAQFVRNSNVEVNYDSALGWVHIFERNNPEGGVFLDGHEGEKWCDKVKERWEELGDMTMEEVELAHAYPYLDAL